VRVAQANAAGAIEIPRVCGSLSTRTTSQYSITREPFFKAELPPEVER
jgi:hypothetical protein